MHCGTWAAFSIADTAITPRRARLDTTSRAQLTPSANLRYRGSRLGIATWRMPRRTGFDESFSPLLFLYFSFIRAKLLFMTSVLYFTFFFTCLIFLSYFWFGSAFFFNFKSFKFSKKVRIIGYFNNSHFTLNSFFMFNFCLVDQCYPRYLRFPIF